jgi:cytosine/adenosine deaminase-related metal-dependent hydrolase
LEVGKCADFIAYDLNHLDYAGGLHDPVAALLLCQSHGVDYNYVQGKPVVKAGVLLGIDLDEHLRLHNKAASRLMEG